MVWNKTGGICWYCGKQMSLPDGEFSVDHFLATTSGGDHEVGNLVPSCLKCNRLKSGRSIESFRMITAGIIAFSKEQISVLKMVGFNDVNERFAEHASKVVFWFEKQGKV
jgi:5-methylcytosine-specific restriction endonuclease McrA